MLAILASIGTLIAVNLGILALYEIAFMLNHGAGVPAWIEWLYHWMLDLYGMG